MLKCGGMLLSKFPKKTLSCKLFSTEIHQFASAETPTVCCFYLFTFMCVTILSAYLSVYHVHVSILVVMHVK